MAGRVRVEREGATAWLVFDQPERRNAVSLEMWQAVPPAVEELAVDDDVRVVVLRGEGEEAFVAGADISQFEQQRTGGALGGYEEATGAAVAALAGLDKPVIAMVHGYCLGGGVSIAVAADLRYSADDGQFGVPAARLGVGYGAGGIERLVTLCGPSATEELFFTGRRFDAAHALRVGLVDGVVPKGELEGFVRETAATIAANAPLTVRSVKFIIGQLARPAERRDTAAMEAAVQACFASEDYREGVRAFLEKRPPVFRGR